MTTDDCLWCNLEDHTVSEGATDLGCAKKIAVGVKNKAPVGICPILTIGKVVERGVGPAPI